MAKENSTPPSGTRFVLTTFGTNSSKEFFTTVLSMNKDGKFSMLGSWNHKGRDIPSDVLTQIHSLKNQNK